MDERFGIRMKLLGKTRSGKSTALFRLITELVPLNWSHILILDGKRDDLAFTAVSPHITYLNATQISQWADELDLLATQMTDRYDTLSQGKPTDPVLLIADEVQAGTRHTEHKKVIKESLVLLAEQSAALGDVIILSAQRQQNSIPPGVTANCNCELTMLGRGYFHFKADGERATAGRASFITKEEARGKLQGVNPTSSTQSSELNPQHLLSMLKPAVPQPRNCRLSLTTGTPGSGLTWHLQQHHSKTEKRFDRAVTVNLAELTHRSTLETILAQCQAVVPSRVAIGDLTQMAAIALSAEPTLLLIDDAHLATTKLHDSLETIIPYAAETAVSFATPTTSQKTQAMLDFYLSRGKRHEIKSLNRATAATLADAQITPTITGQQRQDAIRRAVTLGQGHPKTITGIAQNIERGTLPELRQIEGRSAPKIGLLWLLLALLVAVLIVQRKLIDGYTATIILFAATIILRPFVYRAIRDNFN